MQNEPKAFISTSYCSDTNIELKWKGKRRNIRGGTPGTKSLFGYTNVENLLQTKSSF